MQQHQHLLNNGLTMIGERSAQAQSVAIGFFVRTGARDEAPQVSGVSHFLEHMMFKGTARRSPEAVNHEFDAIGARYNAYTSEENTVYYGNVLPHFQERLLDLLSDMMRPALRDADFDMEKNVILEEIAMYQDRPQFMVMDLARASYFGTHPLGQSVLGSAESIAQLQRDQMHQYFEHRYAANNLTLVLTGKYDWDAAVAQAESSCAEWRPASAPRSLNEPSVEPRTVVRRNDKWNRAHVALLAPGYSAQDERRYAAAVACEAIGAADGSRLYWALVHPGIAEAASLDHDTCDGAGAFMGYLLADPARAQAALDTFRMVVDSACEDGLSADEVERAKRRLASHVVLAAETPMGRLRAVGNEWVYRRERCTSDESLQKLLDVSPATVNETLARRPFLQATVVATGPLDNLR